MLCAGSHGARSWKCSVTAADGLLLPAASRLPDGKSSPNGAGSGVCGALFSVRACLGRGACGLDAGRAGGRGSLMSAPRLCAAGYAAGRTCRGKHARADGGRFAADGDKAVPVLPADADGPGADLRQCSGRRLPQLRQVPAMLAGTCGRYLPPAFGLRQGQANAGDLPAGFCAVCIREEAFRAAVNRALRAQESQLLALQRSEEAREISRALLGQLAGTIAAISGFFPNASSFTLTIPGIAGIILSVGVGVDCNVIASERIKDEFKKGKTIDGAIDSGYKNALSAIIDGNVTIIIVSIVLMGAFGTPDNFIAKIFSPLMSLFGSSITGSIYSFGYTLLMGVVFNLIMGVLASKYMLKSISQFKCLRKPQLYGGKKNA